MGGDRTLMLRKLHIILQRALVESRNLAMQGNRQQIFDLADTFEVLPEIISKWHDEKLPFVKEILRQYQAKYESTAYDYLTILNMEDQAFREVYGVDVNDSIERQGTNGAA